MVDFSPDSEPARLNKHSLKFWAKLSKRFWRKLKKSVSCLFTKNVLVIKFFFFDRILTKLCEIVALMFTKHVYGPSFVPVQDTVMLGLSTRSVARIGVLTPNGCFLTSVWCAKFWVGVFIKKGDFSNIFNYKGENMQISYFCSHL